VATAHETNASNTYGSWGENYGMLEKVPRINKWEWFSGWLPCTVRASIIDTSQLATRQYNSEHVQ
jgi:hypothetical protein